VFTQIGYFSTCSWSARLFGSHFLHSVLTEMERIRQRAFSRFQKKLRLEESQWLLSGLSCFSSYPITFLDSLLKVYSSWPHTFRYIMEYQHDPAQHNDGQASEDGSATTNYVPQLTSRDGVGRTLGFEPMTIPPVFTSVAATARVPNPDLWTAPSDFTVFPITLGQTRSPTTRCHQQGDLYTSMNHETQVCTRRRHMALDLQTSLPPNTLPR
jgi:hypothetical protein